jgi:hypothetical protein
LGLFWGAEDGVGPASGGEVDEDVTVLHDLFLDLLLLIRFYGGVETVEAGQGRAFFRFVG